MRSMLIVVIAAGCGSQELTCPLLADPGNCWAASAAEAAACLPPSSMPGILRADRSGCDFANGATVSFEQPLPMQTDQLERLAFDVTGPGCAWRFVDTFDNRMELTTGGETVVAELHPDREFHLHCADGTTYEAPFDLLFTCSPPSRAPTDGFEVTPTSFSFTLSAVTTPGVLFSCAL